MTNTSANARRMIRDRDRALKTLESLPDSVIGELVRRSGHREQSVSVSGAAARPAKGTHSDPTAGAVIAHMSDHSDADPVYDAVKRAAQALDDIAGLALIVERSVHFVLDAQERQKVAEISHCAACRREVMNTPKDRLKSGYCGRCYMEWYRLGRPYRGAFEIMVRNRELSVQVSHDGTKVAAVG